MVVNPGTLNKRIQICKIESTQNANGFPVESEVTVRECWAKVSTSSGTEMLNSGVDLSTTKVRFFVRYHEALANMETSWYVIYKGKIYDIEFINDYEEAHEYIEIWGTKRCHTLN